MLLLIGGALILVIAALGAFGRLPKNNLAGIRIPSTMRSDAAWVAGHRAAKTPMTLLGVGIMALGVWKASSTEPPLADSLLLLIVVGFSTWAIVVAHRAARQEP